MAQPKHKPTKSKSRTRFNALMKKRFNTYNNLASNVLECKYCGKFRINHVVCYCVLARFKQIIKEDKKSGQKHDGGKYKKIK